MARRSATRMLVVVATVLAGVSATAGGGMAESLACMEGVDTTKTSGLMETYCCLASAVVVTPQAGKVTAKPGTCVRGLRGAGSFDLYLGKDKSGAGPWPLTLHISKPTASAKPGLTMESGFTQWTALSTVKLTLKPQGGSFTGTALVRKNGKNVALRSPIKGTFKC